MTFPACRRKTPKLSKLSKMKIQRNIQQMKKHCKISQDQKKKKKEEAVGCQIEEKNQSNDCKDIQNFGNKMDPQIKRIEGQIKEIQKTLTKTYKR